ncbi:Diacylglycerol O-acyltransferase 1 [Acorus gramineus]|uniref:diacylglycerol O-acyltransferase n=1 Tax=Acorus gramineus TaxID=55184 RepID=A0AAV9APW1_ACOGR|nr:Diacylglycerol O-acyltransferase 1 [Acorus gramineus]
MAFPHAKPTLPNLLAEMAINEKTISIFLCLSTCDSAVISGITLMLIASVVWLKLVSYAHTNFDLRALSNSSKKQSYPRTTCIRKSWVIRQLVKLVIFTGVMGFIIEQYINPIVKNSQHPLKGNFLYALERVLKLSVPTLYVWLCMFYCYFHLWLNILAELLCFGDREFYKDWWNAKTIDEVSVKGNNTRTATRLLRTISGKLAGLLSWKITLKMAIGQLPS